MKSLLFKRLQGLTLLLIMVCGIQFTVGQNTKRMAIQAEATISALDFQKKYVKHLKDEYKLNKDLYNLIEKASKRNPRLKKDRAVKNQLKRAKETLDKTKRAIKNWEDELSSIGEDAQLANIDLQNALQKQQQTLQTMSNVSKLLHDTAMAVIRKIG